MVDTSNASMEDAQSMGSTDPWAEAFAALAQENDEKANDPDTGDDNGSEGAGIPNADTDVADRNADTDEAATRNQEMADDNAQRSSIDVQADAEEDTGSEVSDLRVTEEELNSYRDAVQNDIQERTITAVAKAYIDKGARHTNGKLGASIKDDDICKYDEDGIPHFYNPETGREFTGDDPRAQATQWVKNYNEELAQAFNNTCRDYAQKLAEQSAPQIAVMEFADTYENLDPVRQGMLDSILEDYEITDDNGNVIGYSCDLNSALGIVDRQVRMIQEHYKAQHTIEDTKAQEQPKGPALDIKSSANSGGNTEPPKFNSIAEAMEWQQDQLLANMKKGN